VTDIMGRYKDKIIDIYHTDSHVPQPASGTGIKSDYDVALAS
jgi:hypothetical protein